MILLVESGHLELAAVVSRPVAEDRFVTVQWLVLLDQPDVAWRPVPLGVLEPTLSEREDGVTADVIAFYVDHQKMVLLPELGVLLARRMGVCEDQGIELSWIEAIPQNAARPIRNLCRHQHFALPPPLQRRQHSSTSCRLSSPAYWLMLTGMATARRRTHILSPE